jgi:hypothetical protein
MEYCAIISKLGRQARDAAIYWKYGCSFERKTQSQVLIESQWDYAASEAGAGDIRFRAWGKQADDLIERLLRTLQTLPVGRPPEIKRIQNAKVVINARGGVSSYGTAENAGLTQLHISARPDLPPRLTRQYSTS